MKVGSSDSLEWCWAVCSQPGKNRIWGSSSQRLRPGAVLPPSRDHYTRLLSGLPTIYMEQVHKFISKLLHMLALPTSQTPLGRNQIMGMKKPVADVMILNRGIVFSGMSSRIFLCKRNQTMSSWSRGLINTWFSFCCID